MVSVAAELLVTVLTLNVTGTVAALEVAVIALLTSTMLLNLFCAVQVCAVPRPPTVSVAFGNVITELVPPEVSVIVWLTVNVLPSAIVRMALEAGAVNATLLIDVAVATPSTGVTSVGVPSNTNFPVPVAPVDVTPSMVW